MFGGIRHLIWDQGYLLDVESSEAAGLAMLVVSVLMTIFTAIVL
jgi:succinate dehydrogenase / fumarate reductase cytochrome b subunit